MRRGQGQRCTGFLSENGEYAYCTREEYAGNLSPTGTSPVTYRHKLHGDCYCGQVHGVARPVNTGQASPDRKRSGHRRNANAFGQPGHNGTSRLIATYSYRDADNRLVFQVLRFLQPDGRKTFLQRRPDSETGKWVWSVRGVVLVPYRLPELLRAPQEATAVYIVEGEKDVDALLALGLVATCNPMGAGKWLEDYNGYFAGRSVVILPDNDPPGMAHARQVAAALSGIAVSVLIVCLPGLPEKGDVSDWLATGGTREALEQLVASSVDGDHNSVLPGAGVQAVGSHGEPEAAQITYDGATYSYKGVSYTPHDLGVLPGCDPGRVRAMLDLVAADQQRQREISFYGRSQWHNPNRPEAASLQALDWCFWHDASLVGQWWTAELQEAFSENKPLCCGPSEMTPAAFIMALHQAWCDHDEWIIETLAKAVGIDGCSEKAFGEQQPLSFSRPWDFHRGN